MKSGREKTDFCCFTSFHVPEVNIEELLAASKVLDDLIQLLRKTNLFLSHLYIKTIILPRQAQDKHRENSKKDAVFRTTPSRIPPHQTKRRCSDSFPWVCCPEPVLAIIVSQP
jgi:hypothetical protein